MSQGGPNVPLLAALGTSAYREFSRKHPGWTLQHRHPDGQAWLVIGHFPTKDVEREAAKAFVAADYGPAEERKEARTRWRAGTTTRSLRSQRRRPSRSPRAAADGPCSIGTPTVSTGS